MIIINLLSKVLDKVVFCLEIIPKYLSEVLDRVLNLFTRCVNAFAEALKEIADISYRFICDFLVNSIRAIWYIMLIAGITLAPAFLASFGHEIDLKTSNLIFQIGGWLLLLIGTSGIIMIGIIALLVIFNKSNAPPKSEKEEANRFRKRLWPLLAMDIFAIILVAIWTHWHPNYSFESPLLKITQNSLDSLSWLAVTVEAVEVQ